jgi:hypothetical protein
MKSVLEKIQRRRFFPVEVDGETVHLKSLGFQDALAIDSLADNGDKVLYALGCSLLEEDGVPAIKRGDGESVQQYVARVRELTVDMPPSIGKQLSEAITKITKTPSLDTIAKNSDPTDAPAS